MSVYENQDTLTCALAYRARGWSVIPISPTGSKVPLVKWEKYMRELPSEDQLREWFAEKDAWMGVVTGRISGICVIDIDTIAGEEAIEHILPGVMSTSPMVKTQSGGKHIYFAHPGVRDVRNRTRNLKGCDFRGDGGYVVLPPSRGYEWLQSLEEYDLQILPSDYIREFIDNVESDRKEVPDKVKDAPMFQDGRRDNDLYTTALKLLRGGMSENDALQVLTQLAISWGEDMSQPKNKKWIQTKIISAAKRDADFTKCIASEVRSWVESSYGWFNQRFIYEEVGAKDTKQRKAVREELARQVKADLIEKHKTRSGEFRRRETQLVKIDFKGGNVGKPMDLWLPFGLHEEVNVYPGNIIVIAGEPNSGKSGILLRFVRENMLRWPIDYYSSEMGEHELRIRLDKFELPLEDWHMRVYERAFDFADVIDGDRISVIDYMELPDEFWLVGKHLQAIHEKLQGKRGIAIVAIQKKRGQSLGRGAEFGLEKPRLYMSMGVENVQGKGLQHFLEVIKAKNWAGEVNPNGLKIHFKLIDGCVFLEQSRFNPNDIDF